MAFYVPHNLIHIHNGLNIFNLDKLSNEVTLTLKRINLTSKKLMNIFSLNCFFKYDLVVNVPKTQ